MFHSQQAPCSSVCSASLSPHSGWCTSSPQASGLSWGFLTLGPGLGASQRGRRLGLAFPRWHSTIPNGHSQLRTHDGDEDDFLSCMIFIACMLYTYICMFPVCRYVHVWYMCMHMCMAAGEWSVFLDCSLLYSQRQGLPVEPRTLWSSLFSYLAHSGIPCLTSAGITRWGCHPAWLFHGIWICSFPEPPPQLWCLYWLSSCSIYSHLGDELLGMPGMI